MSRPNVSIDLGSESTKVSLCYYDGFEKIFVPISDNTLFFNEPIPSKAYYDAKTDTWLFGSPIEEGNEKPFENVVSIRFLLSLLEKNKDEKIFNYNVKAYNQGFYFPKFYFPEKKTVGDSHNYMEYVNNEMVFKAKDTPKTICEKFAEYIKEVVDRYTDNYDDYTLSIVYPPRCGQAYIKEYKRIFEKAFGPEHPIEKDLSSTKAIAYYALEMGRLNDQEDFLIFDIGERDISVSKGTLDIDVGESKIIVDATNNHNKPEEVGGADIEEEIYNYIIGNLSDKASVGITDGFDGNRQVKAGLHSKLYLFLNSIKSAKKLLSETSKKALPYGAPISVSLDTRIEIKLDHEKYLENTKKTYAKMLDYIKRELNRSNNRRINKIFLCGGAINSYMLYNYLDDNTEQKCLLMDNATYAPAYGANVVGIDNIDLYIRSALSYGTYLHSGPTRVFAQIVEKGEPLIENTKHYISFKISGSRDEEFLSIPYTKSELRNNSKAQSIGFIGGDLKIGQPSFSQSNPSYDELERRKLVCKSLGLKNLTGRNAEINLYYNNKKIVAMTYGISAREGFIIDSNGNGRPFVEKNDNEIYSRSIEACFSDGSTKYIQPSGIEVTFSGINTIDLDNDNDD